MDEAGAAEFNAFLYWRRPLINLDGAAPVAEDTDDFLRWRRRPGNLVGSLFSRGEPLDGRDASSQSASASTVSSPDPEGLDRARIEGHHDHTTLVDMEEEEEEPEDDDLALLRGGAGARLLAVLGQLSQHLGPQSRFSAASNLLQNDLQQMRAHTGEDEEAQQGSDDSDDAPPSHLRLPSSSALQEPQVIHSMSSMLRLLSDGVSVEPMWQRGGIGMPRTALLSGGTDDLVALPFELPAVPSNPASPLAVSRLPLVDWRDLNAMEEEDFHLDGGQADGTTRTRARTHTHCSCPICLEPFDQEEEDVVLQMPCARQHMFHRACLLQWLRDHNSCPVCRHCLPTQEDEEQLPP